MIIEVKPWPGVGLVSSLVHKGSNPAHCSNILQFQKTYMLVWLACYDVVALPGVWQM